ncbi:ArsR family transcriptional regulator [Candidatus Pacearchaeota archaeon]|nr:ArsR family transcriptional regulator [Candidatus Pacearchaeota archaeon]
MDKALKKEIFFKKSKLRKDIWDKLDKAKTATELAKELNKHRSSVSRVLLDMEKEGLIKCVNPEDKSFRHYLRK